MTIDFLDHRIPQCIFFFFTPRGINKLVQSKIKQTYTNNVEVYVNLLTATPVSVYLSGAIIRPGQYAGMASDSILYFLKRAGGIDSDRGSYRSIQIIRNK